jgi:small subunit ribosomal protein S7
MKQKNIIGNSKNLYSKFLGFLIKKGKKNVAKKTLDQAFNEVSIKTGFSLHFLLLKVFSKLNTFVEVRKIRIRRRSYIVPFSINTKRRSYLAIKWLVSAIAQDNRKVSMTEKLSNEIYKIVTDSPCKSLKTKEFNNSQAISNRSNIHYRW